MSGDNSSLWQHRDFLRLWGGQTVSVFGSMITGAALPFTAVLALDASAAEVAVLTAMRYVPDLVGGPFAGVWVDRLRRRPVMIATDIGRALLLATVPLAWAFDALTIEHLYVVAFGVGLLTLFFAVAYRSYLPSIVEREDILEGNSKLTATAAAAEFSGFSAGGWLVQAFSGPIAILIDAVTFVVSALFLGSIERPEPSLAAPEERTSVYREARDGLRTVASDPILRPLAIVGVLFSLGFGLVGAVISVFALRELDFSPGWLGVIYGVGGLSSVAGAMLSRRASETLGLGPSLTLGMLMMGLAMLLVPFAAGPAVVIAMFLIAAQLGDGGFTIFDVNSMSLRQSITAHDVMGRVNAFFRMSEVAFMLAGTLLGGLLATTVGLRETLGLGAAAVLASAAYIAATPLGRIRATPTLVEEVALDPASP